MKKLIIAALATGVLASQFVRPDRTNPAIDPSASIETDQHIPSEAAAIIRRSCFDCHSNETSWPWYSAITPVNYLIAEDVNAGRKRLNFSNWGDYKPVRKHGLLERISDLVHSRQMPLSRYLYLHPGAKLSDEEVDFLVEWATSEADRILEEDILSAEKGK